MADPLAHAQLTCPLDSYPIITVTRLLSSRTAALVEEEQSISLRGDPLYFTDQDHYKSRTEENQNINNPFRSEESASATTDKQKQTGRKGLKRQRCQRCDKAFTTSGCLKIHQRAHTREKLHSCDQRGRTFSQDSSKNPPTRSHRRETVLVRAVWRSVHSRQ